MNARLFLLFIISSFGAFPSAMASSPLAGSPDGHYIRWKGEDLLLIGESGTQCVTQDANLDYRRWVDDCASRGIRFIHIWSFMAPRQKQDGSVMEERYGYVYPGLTPWARRVDGPPAADQLLQWSLREFDEGEDGDSTRYWPRLRDLCGYAREKNIIVGITVFTGWAKYDANWLYHPLNIVNGGHLDDVDDAVWIASPGAEVCAKEWREDWPPAMKTQWVWERFSDKLIDSVNGLGNVFFVFLDEHSYDEGNMGDHFRDFFHRRKALWMDWSARRESVDFVMTDTFEGADKNKRAVAGFNAAPIRPLFFLEGPPYKGDEVRTAIWSFAMGGGHFAFHADTDQETPQTGIMGYDPRIPGGDTGIPRRDWLGVASRFFNGDKVALTSFAPHNELTGEGAFCLAHPGETFLLYARAGDDTPIRLDLSAWPGADYQAVFYNPRTGETRAAVTCQGGGMVFLQRPSREDWAVRVMRVKPG